MPAAWLLAAFAVYVALGTLIAIGSSRGLSQRLEDYFLANRSLGGLVSALSYAATTYSAFMMVGLAGLTYRGGVGALGFELVYLSGLSLVVFFGPAFWEVGRRFHIVSPAELLSVRYRSPLLGAVVAAASVLFLIPYSSVQLTGIALLLEGMSRGAVPFLVGLTLATAVAVLWAWLGGLRSVAWTDAFQAVIMLISALWVLDSVLGRVGGVGGLFARLQQEDPEWLAVPGNGYFTFHTFLGLSLPWFFFALSNPQVSQRLFTPRSLGSMRRMLLGFLVFGFIYTLVSVLWGLAGRVLIPGLPNPDLLTPSLLASPWVPPAVALVAMVGIMAAAVSTIDSILLTLSSMVARDLYATLAPGAPEHRQLQVGKLAIPVIALLAFLFARMRLGLIAVLSVASSAGLLVTVPAIIGAFYWPRATASGALASILGGSAVVVWAQLTGARPLGAWPGVWGLIVATALFVGVSLLSRPVEAPGAEFRRAVERTPA